MATDLSIEDIASMAAGPALRGLPWEMYLELRELDANYHTRMTYHDGMLFLVSPEYRHNLGAERLGVIIREISDAFDIEYACTRTTTLRRAGDGTFKGDAKEPDTGFYIGDNEAIIRGKTTIDLDVVPPPDLAIEVDNKSDSAVALPTYAGLLVPEVWRYDSRKHTLWFGRLEGGVYETIDRSVCLPMLTPALVIAALDAFRPEMSERTWERWVREWARAGRAAWRLSMGCADSEPDAMMDVSDPPVTHRNEVC
jgi:Uma2 family endonuclease